MQNKDWFSFSKIKKYFYRQTWTGIKTVHERLTQIDQAIIFVLILAIFASGFFIWRNHWIKTTYEVPANGGTLVEGIVGEPKNLDQYLARLTSAGLTKLQHIGLPLNVAL